eukprot:1161752-Pelagomonas_calceolata.AAC.10
MGAGGTAMSSLPANPQLEGCLQEVFCRRCTCHCSVLLLLNSWKLLRECLHRAALTLTLLRAPLICAQSQQCLPAGALT